MNNGLKSKQPLIIGGGIILLIVIVVGIYFVIRDNRKDGDECEPTDDEKVENADDDEYVIEVDEEDDTKTCVPGKCVVGYNLTDGQCDEVVDCVMSQWSECDSNCNQTRTIETQPVGSGEACTGLSQSCTGGDCPSSNDGGAPSNVDCVMSQWSGCDSNCNQTRTIETQPVGSGEACTGLSQSCTGGACPSSNDGGAPSDVDSSNDGGAPSDVDCVVSQWSGCNSNCKQTRTQPAENREACPTELIQSCTGGDCPYSNDGDVDCVVSQWSGCNSDCKQTRTQPVENREACPTELIQSCTGGDCPVTYTEHQTKRFSPGLTQNATGGPGTMTSPAETSLTAAKALCTGDLGCLGILRKCSADSCTDQYTRWVVSNQETTPEERLATLGGGTHNVVYLKD
jgi:hypothetical protein